MPNFRVIPVILLKNGRVVQSKLFKRHQVLGSPSTIVGRLSNWSVDELIYLDISRNPSYDLKRDDLNFANKGSILEIIEDFSKSCFMPLTIGGGIKTISDVESRLAAGADKVTINTQAFKKPQFITKCATRFGSQCIVASIDVRKSIDNSWEVFISYGKEPTGVSPQEWAKRLQESGAGEILINSIDNDGQGQGYDLDLVKKVVNSVHIPVIALGGVGQWSHLADCMDKANPSAVAAANIFQYTENSVYSANKYLHERNYKVRKPSLKTIIEAGDR
jgi:imidazole glycerol-phosphate synthase subunit HisF